MSHLIFNRLILSCAVFALCACATSQPEQPQMVAEPQVKASEPYNPDNADIFSNQNVIVYSLDKPIELNKRSFAPHRGVLENTTAGGFTVFDPSVIVYALDGVSTKPDYLPDYSVPRYAQEVPLASQQQSMIPAMPDDLMIDESYLPNPPSLSGQSMGLEPLKVIDVPARRSRPLLTAYE